MMDIHSISQITILNSAIRLPKLRFLLQEVGKVLSEDQQAYITKYVLNLYYILNQEHNFFKLYTTN